MFRQADAVVVKQYDGDGNSCGKSLIFGQRGNKSADGNQSGAHDKKCQQRAIGCHQIHIPKLRKNQRIQGHDAQRNKKYDQQCQIFTHNNLGSCNRKGI